MQAPRGARSEAHARRSVTSGLWRAIGLGYRRAIRRPCPSSGELSKAIGRGVASAARACRSSPQPRTWRPIKHTDEEIAAFRAAAAAAGMGPLVSHGLYLINLGAPDRDVPTGPPGKPAVAMRNIYRTSVESLVQHLTYALGLAGVVLHVGSFRGSTEDEAIARIGAGIAEALALAEGDCCVYLEHRRRRRPDRPHLRPAPRGGRRGRGAGRLAFCLDSQHLFASEVPGPRGGRHRRRALAEFDEVLGLDRLRCLHLLNDSKVAFASNRDRHENIGDGEIGEEGIRRILGHPDLQGLPVILEVPGMDGTGTDLENMARARRLHEEGLAARS